MSSNVFLSFLFMQKKIMVNACSLWYNIDMLIHIKDSNSD